MNTIKKLLFALGFAIAALSSHAQQTPLKNGLFQGTLNGTPSGGTLNLASLTLTLGTPTISLASATGLPISGITSSTSTALGLGSLELGHATDTTLARVSAGVVSIEGVTVATATNTITFTNKSFTAPILGTPLSGNLTNCTLLPLTTGITGTLAAANGGTNLTSYAVGDLLYASGTTALSKLPDVATGSVLISGGVGVAPSYSATPPVGAANMTGIGQLGSGEVSVTAATTLTSTAFGKMHVCSGTSANYTVDLPAASGNAGKVIGFRMSSALTKLVTIDPNASELVDTDTTVILFAQESAVFMCDGTGWTKIMGKARAMRSSGINSSATSMPTGTATKVTLGTLGAESFSGMLSTANSRITAQRKGMYSVSATVSYELSGVAVAGAETYVQIYKNGAVLTGPAITIVTPSSTTGGNTYAMPAVSGSVPLNAGDYLEVWGIQTTGSTMQTRTVVDQVKSNLTVVEIPGA